MYFDIRGVDLNWVVKQQRLRWLHKRIFQQLRDRIFFHTIVADSNCRKNAIDLQKSCIRMTDTNAIAISCRRPCKCVRFLSFGFRYFVTWRQFFCNSMADFFICNRNLPLVNMEAFSAKFSPHDSFWDLRCCCHQSMTYPSSYAFSHIYKSVLDLE